MRNILCFVAILITTLSSMAAGRKDVLRGSLGTYGTPPRLENGRVDCDKLIDQLIDLHANCYGWLIHGAPTDWDDLKLFLPMAQARNLRVWVNLVPPSESPPRSKVYSEPYRLDYQRWAFEFAKLSLEHRNLVGWSIDDFPYNIKVFTPEKMKEILDSAHAINPNFAFVPCVYYKQITPDFIKNYIPLFDGILFPYRDESHGANLKDPSHVEEEVKSIRQRIGEDYPIIVDIYFTAHSRLGATTPEYDRTATLASHACADGVQVYTHQSPTKNPEKYQIIKELFTQWNPKSDPAASSK